MEKKELTPEEVLADEVEKDFLARQQERRLLERSWQLNMNFVNGNQYCDIDEKGEIYEEEKTYYWQDRRVFNHIAPIVDTRLSKLSRIRPALTVRAASDDEEDKRSAALASALLAAAQEDADLDGVMSAACVWSELCGTAFYKIMWRGDKGNAVAVDGNGKKVYEGRAEVAAVSPFEIYPYSLYVEDLDEQPSIIHAKALPLEKIYEMYGVKLEGRDLEEVSPAKSAAAGYSSAHMPQFKDIKRGYEIVIERYEKPAESAPEGRLTVVAGGRLLYDGILPYANGGNGLRGYPFVKQCSTPLAGRFFGSSIIERLIPLQRAYNAVKNRKHEFLNRIAMGTVAVEDGSVDLDEFTEDGLVPGKVLVYRQGSKPPEMLTLGSVPSEFSKEEENLLNEFVKISGTGDLSENADSFAGITSATGLQLIIEQDDQRFNVTYSSMKRAAKLIGRHILRLYRQFATAPRLMKYAGKSGEVNVLAFKGSDISSDDVVLDADGDLNMTAAQKRTVVYEILDRGLFADGEGKLSATAKNKILELLGYGSMAGGRDLAELHRARAESENAALLYEDAEVKDYDDHNLHIEEHTAYLLCGEADGIAEKRICAHIEAHRKFLKNNSSEAENG